MISSNVKRLMAAKGLTNQTLAARARISADTVVRTKSERIRECSLDTLISIAQTLGVQTKDLYCESSEMQAGSEQGAEPSLLTIELGTLIKYQFQNLRRKSWLSNPTLNRHTFQKLKEDYCSLHWMNLYVWPKALIRQRLISLNRLNQQKAQNTHCILQKTDLYSILINHSKFFLCILKYR